MAILRRPLPRSLLYWSPRLLLALYVMTKKLLGRSERALIAPLIQFGLIRSATRTTSGLPRNGAASAVTRQAMGTPETCAVMTASPIGRTCARARLLSTYL